jgi:hypothetical protein
VRLLSNWLAGDVGWANDAAGSVSMSAAQRLNQSVSDWRIDASDFCGGTRAIVGNASR